MSFIGPSVCHDAQRISEITASRRPHRLCPKIVSMPDPINSVSHNPMSIASWVLAEAIGTSLLYMGIFTGRRNQPPAAWLLRIFAFSIMGLILLLGSVVNLQSIHAGWPVSAVTFVVVLVLLSALALFRRSRDRRAHTWPKVAARVEESGTLEVRTRSTHYFLAQFAYSYEMNHEYYSGRFERSFESESEASDYVQALKGTKIPVSVNPQRPEDSQVFEPPTLS